MSRVIPLPTRSREDRDERTFALSAADHLEERPPRRQVPPEPPPTGRHVPRRESCNAFMTGLIIVLAGSVLAGWALLEANRYFKVFG